MMGEDLACAGLAGQQQRTVHPAYKTKLCHHFERWVGLRQEGGGVCGGYYGGYMCAVRVVCVCVCVCVQGSCTYGDECGEQ